MLLGVFLLIGIVLGGTVGWLVSANKFMKKLQLETKAASAQLLHCKEELAIANATNSSFKEKLHMQELEMEKLTKKFHVEFENMANHIFESKVEKFSELSKSNLQTILGPFKQSITEFKNKVEEVYHLESKERFSLGEKVKELAQLNQVISEEARSLTRALKGEAKTQGRWGEMILESILEKSGLTKNREYFVEQQLLDDQGAPLKSDFEKKKMRPDVIIKYPDNRSVIIDAKVSLNAYCRFNAATDKEEQKKELQSHITAVKNHIQDLSAKGYDDYSKSLDFIMMFMPSEPAYLAVLQGDPEIWNFAYEKRILLLSPTNLITSLKLISDLWKRENQNRNALEIAERGAKLYDKFVGFVVNFDMLGKYLRKTRGKYNEIHKQLSTGNDNLLLQASKLKNLGIKNKKNLPESLAIYPELEPEFEQQKE